jgi:hypothetical protein
MTDTEPTPEEIEGVRRQLKSGLDELLECDALWRNKLTREILNNAQEQADGHVHVLVNKDGRFCPFQVENFHRELLRDLIATGMVRELILAWARGRGMSD